MYLLPITIGFQMTQFHQIEDTQLPNQSTRPGESPPTPVEIYNSRNAFVFRGKQRTKSSSQTPAPKPSCQHHSSCFGKKALLRNERYDPWPGSAIYRLWDVMGVYQTLNTKASLLDDKYTHVHGSSTVMCTNAVRYGMLSNDVVSRPVVSNLPCKLQNNPSAAFNTA